MLRLYNKLVHTNDVNDNSCSVIYKFTNILLLLLLTFGNYGVSFGMENSDTNQHTDLDIAPHNCYFYLPSLFDQASNGLSRVVFVR